jgi:glutamate N-acetyltransferase/amino-acid N-acetyltransferase
MLALLGPGTTVAGVMTRSLTRSAPVEWCARQLRGGRARAIIVNAGNANAFTGRTGMETVREVTRAAARAFDCRAQEIFVASTGVIGEPLDPRPIIRVLPELGAKASADGWQDAAAAILTTDTFAKAVSVTARLGGRTVTINGFAKGSGMIAPDMATMLAFLFTDASVPQRELQALLARSAAKSFNCITVDGDTSTSDTLLLAATGSAGPAPKGLKGIGDRRLADFAQALDRACLELAHLVVKDGEGAEKFIAVTVEGGQSDEAARKIGLAVANSPLVKTAIAGEDANWGRIVMAVGKSGQKAERDKLAIWIGGIRVAHRGRRDPNYREEEIAPHMKGRSIDIRIHVGVGKGRATVWTCDLTHRYIDINGSYRS